MYGYIWVCMGIYGYIWVTQVNIIPQKDHSEKLDCLDLDAFHKTSLNWGGTSQLSRPGDKQVKQVEILVKTMTGKTLTILLLYKPPDKSIGREVIHNITNYLFVEIK